MNYYELASLLKENFKQVTVLSEMKKGETYPYAVEFFSSALSMYENVLKVKEIVGDKFKVTGSTNSETITIK